MALWDDVYETETEYGHYLVADTIYSGRPARVLYSGDRQAAQSGAPRDQSDEMLFDYNERFMELARHLLPEKLLLIGGGAFTLPKVLQSEFPEMHIDVVELDPALLDIARSHFGYTPSDRTRVFFGDGRVFLDKHADTYDLIAVDAFMHTTMPSVFQTKEAAESFHRHLKTDGVLAMNLITAYHGIRSSLLRRMAAALSGRFETVTLFPAGKGLSLWLPQNFIITAQNGGRDLSKALRFGSVDLPSVDEADVYRDDEIK